MTIEDIMKILPHRYPFLLVDRVIEKNGTDTLVAIKTFSRKTCYAWGSAGGSYGAGSRIINAGTRKDTFIHVYR